MGKDGGEIVGSNELSKIVLGRLTTLADKIEIEAEKRRVRDGDMEKYREEHGVGHWWKKVDNWEGKQITVAAGRYLGDEMKEGRKVAVGWGEGNFIEIWYNPAGRVTLCRMLGSEGEFPELMGQGKEVSEIGDSLVLRGVLLGVDYEQAIKNGARMVIYDASNPVTEEGFGAIRNVLDRWELEV